MYKLIMSFFNVKLLLNLVMLLVKGLYKGFVK